MLKRDFSGAYLTTEKSAANQKISDFLVKNSLTPPSMPIRDLCRKPFCHPERSEGSHVLAPRISSLRGIFGKPGKVVLPKNEILRSPRSLRMTIDGTFAEVSFAIRGVFPIGANLVFALEGGRIQDSPLLYYLFEGKSVLFPSLLQRLSPQRPPKILQRRPEVKVEASKAAWLEARAW
jgi:hypothetical protein